MNYERKIKLSTPKLPIETQHQVDELQRAFISAEQNLKNVESRGHLYGKSAEHSNRARKSGNELLKQKGHDANTHREILKWYTQSISLAPTDSEELVLGYGNRSALLMHLQHYEEALVDINQAIKFSKSDDYKKKLQARKERCTGLLNEQNLIKSTRYMTLTEKKELKKIRSRVENFNPSATVLCAADCVGVAYNDQLGRHLVATRDIKPGEFVIVEQGYACTPLLDRLHLVCSHCLQYAFNGVPCDKCAFAIYCSETCKNEAFKEYHDIECPMLKYLWSTVFQKEEQGSDRIVSLRILIKAIKEEGFESVIKEILKERNEESFEILLSDGILKSDFKACYNLVPYIKKIGKEHEMLESNTFLILYLLVKYTNFLASSIGKNPFSDKTTIDLEQPVFHNDGSITMDPRILLKLKEALMKLKSITATNQYGFQTGTWQCGYCNNLEEHRKVCKYSKGYVTVPCCSLLNHSCTPNVRHVCTSKRKIIVFSVCPIKKGEMLCSSYRSTTIMVGDVKDREIKLKNFICKCRACLDNVKPSTFLNDYIKDVGKIRYVLKNKLSASMAQTYILGMDDYEISEKMFQDLKKISQLLYKQFNYYKAFAHNARCHSYFEKVMAKLYQDKIFMPNDC